MSVEVCTALPEEKRMYFFLGNGIRLANVHFLLNFENYIQSLKCQLDFSLLHT